MQKNAIILCWWKADHFEFEAQRKVISNEKPETYISQLQIMQKQEIVQLFFGKKLRYVVLAAIFCFANLKVKDTKYRTLSD